MRAAATLAVLAVLASAIPLARAEAPAASRPVLVELFTSQGCSSCPPADAFLGELARTQPDVLALSFHITYWDNLGWRDPFALQDATDRQRAYAKQRGAGSVYTPQMVIDGRADVVGSDRASAWAAIRQAGAAAARAVPIAVARDAQGMTISIAAGPGEGTVWLVGFDASHKTAIARGENGGRSLTESNVVRAIEPGGAWRGAALTLRHATVSGERVVVLLQAPDGRVIGVGVPSHDG